ncbi:MAG TPA: polysaccharide deacetylase family protein [Gaiellaceae bacterium]|nr:polysaccharide deacetylase family protein [Gaiellaceae bacterium]
MTLSESERRRADGSLPPRCVVVTFDDGFHSALRATEVLDRLGYPATVFVVTSFADSGEPLCWPGIEQWRHSHLADEVRPLRWNDLEKLRDAGWEIGSHTVTHALLTGLDGDRLARELRLSREAIARRFGSCETVAYPYGRADDRVAAAARSIGYSAGCTLTGAHVIDEPYRRPRVGLSGADRGLRMRAQLSPVGPRLRRSWLARVAGPMHRSRRWLPTSPSGGASS